MILSINSGSQSLKYSLYDSKDFNCIDSGEFGNIFHGGTYKNHKEAIEVLSEKLRGSDVTLVAHRVAHGGIEYRKPTLINNDVLEAIKEYSILAPLHNPAELDTIIASQKIFTSAKHVAVFDSGFYTDMPDYATSYGIPKDITQKLKIQRIGFHGLSHEYASTEACKEFKMDFDKASIISCHLGGGSSITAIKNGKAIDTSMGFTPSEGLLMMTRSGDIDPGVMFYIADAMNLNMKKLEELLLKKSGMAGMTGYDQDMKKILEQYSKNDENVKLAVDLFFYRIKKYIGSYFGILGDIDIIVFTGSIGARQEDLIRKKVLEGLPFYNDARICFMETDEQIMLAKKASELVNK